MIHLYFGGVLHVRILVVLLLSFRHQHLGELFINAAHRPTAHLSMDAAADKVGRWLLSR